MEIKLTQAGDPSFQFYSSLHETPVDAAGTTSITPRHPRRSRLAYNYLPSSESGSAEYKSIIDDLTIENKQLKIQLKRYESSYDSLPELEKLFEIKFHALQADKKRELEEVLSKFALGLATSPKGRKPISSVGPSTSQPARGKPSSSQTSTKMADSGYGSMNVSNQASMSRSRHHNTGPNRIEETKVRERDIRSYLHDIPEGLLPRQAPAMTKKAKKKLVVSRLEQIFGGRGAAVEGHQQPLQQQEVSNIAANDDRNAMEASGERATAEGAREARILNRETEDAPENVQTARRPRLKSEYGTILELEDEDSTVDQDGAVQRSICEQRPTKPLDLDPYRAQVPTDNINYIRHLGFSVRNVNSEVNIVDSREWVYLNLLTNMAQLHMINVTMAFVKEAVAEYSDKFEISSDGQKIRWSGGQDITRNSSISPNEAQHGSHVNSDRRYDIQNRKRKRSLLSRDDNETPQHAYGPLPKKRAFIAHSKNQFSYAPVFGHESESKIETDMLMPDGDPSWAVPPAEDTLAHDQLFLDKTAKRSSTAVPLEDGPIIFYNNATFCTDLSGDRAQPPYQKVADYQLWTSFPIGVLPQSSPASPSMKTTGKAVDRPFIRGLKTTVPPRIAQSTESSSEELHFPPPSPKGATFANLPEPRNFEACGIGGVQLDDNFTFTVRRQRALNLAASPLPTMPVTKFSRLIPTRRPPASISERILSSRLTILPPSDLPPACLAYLSDDESSDSDSTMPEAPGSSMDIPTSLPPLKQISRLAIGPATSTGFTATMNKSSPGYYSSTDIDEDEDEDDDDDDDDDDDGDGDGDEDDQSLDFLATARAVNPAAIRAKEREYDAEMAERLAEEIRAGSSAATGGWSGLATPVDTDDGVSDGSVSTRRDG